MAATLLTIRDKVRRLTRSPSISQLSDADINDYINTFILYDIPNQLRLFNLRKTFTFYTKPNIGWYQSNTIVGDPFYDFKNLYISAEQPAYCAGYPMFWSQSREQFYNIYPEINTILSIGTVGDGTGVNFTGTVNAVPLLRTKVTFVSKDASNNPLYLTDGFGTTNPTPGDGLLYGTGTGTIDYLTGVFSLTFSTPPAAGAAINSETVPYTASRPNALLYFNDAINLRPIPDQVYQVNFEVYNRPTSLLVNGDIPELEQWWQYIAYGASKKIFEDRSDLDSVNLIMPEYKVQERLVLRRTIVDMTKERASTIYTEQTGIGAGGFGWNPMGGPF